MAPSIGRRCLGNINKALKMFNMKIDTCTKDKLYDQYIERLKRKGYFKEPQRCHGIKLNAEKALDLLRNEFNAKNLIKDTNLDKIASELDIPYHSDNAYFSSIDAEILFYFISFLNPKVYLEIGSGNSTLVAKVASIKNLNKTRIYTIDPRPRFNIAKYIDRHIALKLEDTDLDIFKNLKRGDILFIDSSHKADYGGDVYKIFFDIFPIINKGVYVHFHDIFFPYPYPEFWYKAKRNFNESHFLQAFLMYNDEFDVIWPGYYLFKSYLSDLEKVFDRHLCNCMSTSLWVKKNQNSRQNSYVT